MPDVVINYETIVKYIGCQMQYIWQELAEDENSTSLISSIKQIQVSDEQFFRKQESSRTLQKGTVYLIVRFSAGAINYASSVTPISIYGLGVANQVKPVQLLLGTFASYWTTLNLGQGLTDSEGRSIETNETRSMLQVWNTPEVVSNFNIVDEDFRNLYRVTGNIVVGPAAIRLGTLTYYFEGKDKNGNIVPAEETVNIMTFQDNLHMSLDSQPFGDTNGFVQSEGNFSTYTFTISTYLLNGQLGRDVLAMRGFRYRPSGTYNVSEYDAATDDKPGAPKFSIADTNKVMKLKLQFNNGFNNMPGTGETTDVTNDPVKGDDFYMMYKVVDSAISQEIAGIPSLTISFVR